MIAWFNARFREPSSWSALAIAVSMWAPAFPRFETAIYGLSGICATVAFVMKEAKNAPDEP